VKKINSLVFIKLSIVSLLTILMMSNLVFAVHTVPEEEAHIIDITEDITYERPAPNSIIQKATTYIINFVGEDYFNSYISLNDSYKITYGPTLAEPDHYAVIYSYSIPNKNVYIKAPDSFYTPKVYIRFDLDGNITSYDGPNKPYKFLVDEEQALEIAKKNGVENPIDGYLSQTAGVWEVYGPFNVVGVETIYLDVDTGEVIRRYVDSGVRESSEGEIALPNLTPVGIWWEIPKEFLYILLTLVSVIIISIIGFIWFIRHKKR